MSEDVLEVLADIFIDNDVGMMEEKFLEELRLRGYKIVELCNLEE